MLRRKIYADLLSRKKKRQEEHLRKCLIVKRTGQVGKSYIIREFGKNEYESLIEIDFFRHPELKAIFETETVTLE